LAQAVDGGFIVNRNPGRGRTAQYAIGDPVPGDQDVLPDVADLASPNLVNLVNQALNLGDTDPSPSLLVCALHPDGAVWQAHDHAWYCRICNPPLFPGEVLNERPGR
jgi:hypothetical protein